MATKNDFCLILIFFLRRRRITGWSGKEFLNPPQNSNVILAPTRDIYRKLLHDYRRVIKSYREILVRMEMRQGSDRAFYRDPLLFTFFPILFILFDSFFFSLSLFFLLSIGGRGNRFGSLVPYRILRIGSR